MQNKQLWRARSRRNTQFNWADFSLVPHYLKKKWSPEQISAYMSLHDEVSMSHQTIYPLIRQDRQHGGTLCQHLRGANKKRRKGYAKAVSRGIMRNKRSIDTRPFWVNDRSQLGHWEIDTVMGKGSKDCIVNLVERKTGFTVIGKLRDRTTASLNEKVIEIMRKNKAKFLSVTADNGTEFNQFKEMEKATNAIFYFAHPYRSWERGTNENTNGLIRQYLPKGTSIAY